MHITGITMVSHFFIIMGAVEDLEVAVVIAEEVSQTPRQHP